MPGNLRFPSKPASPLGFVWWLLAACCFTLTAQVHRVDPQKTVTFDVPGASAAYSLDASLADANAENGVVSLTGKQPGTTHVVVVTPSGVQTFDVLVTTPPPHYPPGFEMPLSGPEMAQTGYLEGRYYSSPAQVQSQLDFVKIHGDDRTHMHLVETNLLGALDQDRSRIALSSATYQIVTPRRDVTLFDKYLDESQLTINGSIVRGFHLLQDNWFVHAGYTSVATFEGLFLPTQPELVIGGGYRQPLTANSSLTGSFYQLRTPASDLLGRSGGVGDLRYKYAPRENFWFTADLGISRGIAGAGQLYYRTERDSVTALIRYMPVRFASLGANNFRGLHTDVSWTRHVTPKFESTFTFYNNNIVLPNLKETTISGSANLRYQLTRRWAVTGGAIASTFQTQVPASPAIRSFTLPVGLSFQSRHFGASGQYQFAVTPGRESGSQQTRASLHAGWGAFNFTGYGERDTNAPTLSFIFGQVAGLQQLLAQQGIQATTVQQVDELLASNSYLIAAGYIKGASINLVPVRLQLGGTADWSSRGVHRKQVSYSILYNDNQMLHGSTQDVIHTVAYSHRITRSDEVSAACSFQGVKNPGGPLAVTPVCFLAWRHQFQHVPYLIIPERRGAIAGNVFRDDRSAGAWEPGMPPIAEVEVRLDDGRHMLTRADGSYRFSNVPRGKHRIAALYHSPAPFFFTTPADTNVEENATVNFGIGYSLSGLTGAVLNDAGQGVGSVTIVIQGKGKKWNAVTEADGSFFVSALVAGEYSAQVDDDSLPAGYSSEALVALPSITVGASSPGRVAFIARALRSVAGRVLRYNPAVGSYQPVAGARVILRERGTTAVTDAAGRYLFRDLAAGTYTVVVENQTQTPAQPVRLGAQPVDLKEINFQISELVVPAMPAPAVVSRVKSAAPALVTLPKTPAPAANTPVRQSATAQQRNTLGRQFAKAGRYAEAIAELTEALRMAPEFAPAWNARGFARLMLHDCAGARDDLDRAIILNPGYADAYKIRAAARRAIGDIDGAAVDLKKFQDLAD